MAQARRTARRWGFTIVVVVLGLAIVVEAFFLAPVVKRQAEQSREGLKAKQRQEQVFPVSCRIYVDAYKRGVITSAELRVFETPKRCVR